MAYNPQGVTTIKKYRSGGLHKFGSIVGERPSHKSHYVQLGEGYPKSVLDFKNNEKDLHPTQKPIALLEYMIRTYTNEGETVLDNCMGIGSTGVASVNADRNFIGMELDPVYFDIAKKRIEEAKINLYNGNS